MYAGVKPGHMMKSFFQVTTPMLVWTKRMVRLPDVVAVKHSVGCSDGG